MSFETGLPAKMFRHICQTVLRCWASKVSVLNGQDIA